MNIVELLLQDGIRAEHASRVEWHSSCPECGGKDRFSSWPEKVNSNGRYLGGRFCCRQCGWNGDGISYIMKRRGLSFMDAVKALGIDPGQMPEWDQHQRRTWEPAPPKVAAGAVWQARTRAFVLNCQHQLKQNNGALQWLSNERGLSDETVRAAHLGWNEQDKYDSRAAWGLEPETNGKTGRDKKVWLPGGLVIPCFDEAGNVIRLRVRRTVADQYGRYIVVTGSSMSAMIQWHEQRAVCIVESELDGLLIQQEAGAVVGVVALGSAQAKPDSELHGRLMKAEMVLCCLDSDQAGARAAWGHWRNYPGFKRWPTIKGKDVTEQWRAGVPVRAWIEAGL